MFGIFGMHAIKTADCFFVCVCVCVCFQTDHNVLNLIAADFSFFLIFFSKKYIFNIKFHVELKGNSLIRVSTVL